MNEVYDAPTQTGRRVASIKEFYKLLGLNKNGQYPKGDFTKTTPVKVTGL